MPLPLTKEELLLTLHCYFEHETTSITPDTTEVQWLSDMLRRMPIHPDSKRSSRMSFRPPDGVDRRVREFQRIDGGDHDVPSKYLDVWNQYADDEAALLDAVHDILSRYASEVQGPDALQPLSLYKETQRRIETWTTAVEELGTDGLDEVPSHQIEAWSIDQTQAGIYRDKARTGTLTVDGHGVTVSVLHTGSRYEDDLGNGKIIYHYPDTNRPAAHDQGEIEATKNAARYGVPLFVQIPSSKPRTRGLRIGYITGWDDEAKTFSVRFGATLKEAQERARAALSGDKTAVDLPQDNASIAGWSLPTEIPHLKRPNASSFYLTCCEHIHAATDATAPFPPVWIQFDRDADGYPGDVRIWIDQATETDFKTDWRGSTLSRFPGRLKAAATALRDTGHTGAYRLWHEKGDLVILPAEYVHVDPASLRSEDSSDDASHLDRSDGSLHQEGAAYVHSSTRYERSSAARDACISHYGLICQVCEMNFASRYGEATAGFIHVHHLTPVSEIGENYTVDPINDLRPVCPNCHAVIHRRSPPYSIDDVQGMMRSNHGE